jgi:hypothetical protein
MVRKIVQSRLQLITTFALLTAGACEERRPPVQEPPKPAEPKPQVEPGKPVQGCVTRFALGPARTEGGKETCALPQDTPRGWRLVARQSEPPKPDPNDPSQKSRDSVQKNAVPSAAAPAPSPDAPWRVGPAGTPFCVYEWGGDRVPAPEEVRRIGAEPECGLAFGAADAVAPPAPEGKEGAPEPALARAFDRQARGFDAAALTAAQEILKAVKPKDAPRIAVVDASPFGIAEPDLSGHGFAVSRIIAALACPDPESAQCQEMIRPYLALPLIWDATVNKWVTGPRGGRFGYFHHLFERFQAALAERAPGQNLIVNLSLGWDPVKTDPNGREMVLMTELLQRAYCEGVLVIAAAGNRTGSEGPILPAAIESAVPDRTRCQALTDPRLARKIAPAGVGSYRPLIHAVGAVDIRDERLVSSRPWGNPRLVAYGMALSVPAPKTPSGYTDLSTGTSPAAAVASGITGAVWGLKPNLDPHDAIGIVYKSGRLLDGKSGNRLSRTEFCLDVPTGRCEKWPVRRASLCEALRAVSGKGLKCIDPAAKLPDDLFPTPKGPNPTTPPPSQPPCRVSNCGLPVGPSSSQLSAGAYPHDTVAGCPGCTLRRNDLFGLGRVYGTPTQVPTPGVSTVVRTWTWIYPWGWTPQDFWIPYPSQNNYFSYYLGTSPATLQAEIVWTFALGPIYLTDSTPLIVQ